MNWNEIAEQSGKFKSTTREKNAQPERILQRNICNHLRTFYPDVYFMSDPSGIKLSPNVLKLLKATRSSHNQLDIVILEPFNIYKGLILEVKAETPYKLNGELKTDDHLKDQFEVMRMLNTKGYYCDFVWNIEMAMNMFVKAFGEPKLTEEPLF